MQTALFVLSALSALFGVAIFATAKAVTHEILGGCFFLIAAVLFIGAAIVREVRLLRGQVPLPERSNSVSDSLGQLDERFERQPTGEAVINADALDVLVKSGRLSRPS